MTFKEKNVVFIRKLKLTDRNIETMPIIDEYSFKSDEYYSLRIIAISVCSESCVFQIYPVFKFLHHNIASKSLEVNKIVDSKTGKEKEEINEVVPFNKLAAENQF